MTLFPQTRDERNNDLDSARWWAENACPKARPTKNLTDTRQLHKDIEQIISDVRKRTTGCSCDFCKEKRND